VTDVQAVDLLITGGLVVTMDAQRRVIEDGAVAVAGDRIAAVGPRQEVARRFRAARTIEAGRRVVRPGYVDGHVHVTAEMLARGFFPDWVGQKTWVRDWATSLYAAIQPHEEHVAALMACAEMLRNGTTAFCEGGTILHMEQVARAIEQAGIRGVLGRWTWDLVPSPASVHSTVEQALERAEELVEHYHGSASGRIRALTCVISSETASERLLRGLHELAVGRGVMLNFHQSGYADYIPEARARWGVRPIEYLRNIGVLGPNTRLVHMVHVNDEEVDLLRASDTRVVHCPTTALRLAYGASSVGRFPEMLAAGVTVALGTDGTDASDQLDMSRSVYLAAGIFKDGRQDPSAMPVETALEMATLHGARSIHWEAEIGSLEVGKKADIVLLDRDRPEMVPIVNVANTLAYAADGRCVRTVLVDGKVVVEDGRVITFDEREVYREVERLAPQLIARSGLPLHRRWSVIGEMTAWTGAARGD
jgi:cytosine/adenosine deaminase-related metal-dependent hydrolase